MESSDGDQEAAGRRRVPALGGRGRGGKRDEGLKRGSRGEEDREQGEGKMPGRRAKMGARQHATKDETRSNTTEHETGKRSQVPVESNHR